MGDLPKFNTKSLSRGLKNSLVLFRGLNLLNRVFNPGRHDYLSGEIGADTLTGGLGNDVFALAIGTGGTTLAAADVITDFSLNKDKIDLISPLSFDQLIISQGIGANVNDTIIQYQPTGEYLAVLKGVEASNVVLGLTI